MHLPQAERRDIYWLKEWRLKEVTREREKREGGADRERLRREVGEVRMGGELRGPEARERKYKRSRGGEMRDWSK